MEYDNTYTYMSELALVELTKDSPHPRIPGIKADGSFLGYGIEVYENLMLKTNPKAGRDELSYTFDHCVSQRKVGFISRLELTRLLSTIEQKDKGTHDTIHIERTHDHE